MVRTVCANREQGGGQREVRAPHLDHTVCLPVTVGAVVEQENTYDLCTCRGRRLGWPEARTAHRKYFLPQISNSTVTEIKYTPVSVMCCEKAEFTPSQNR